jgi:hypothetical protein
MPLLYGEGEKAFLRLQEEIIRRSNDLSIFAWGYSKSALTGNQERQIDLDQNQSDNYSINPDDCCNLFAMSPKDFDGCQNLTLPTEKGLRNFAFSMTNNGIFLTRIRLRLSYENNCYILPLRCYDQTSPTETAYLALRKVSTDLFVKLRHCQWYHLFEEKEEVDGYIISSLTSLTRSLVSSAHVNSVQLGSQSTSKPVLHASIQEVSPRDMWDPSRLAVLHGEDHQHQMFAGYFKFSGRRLTQSNESTVPNVDDFYLAWGGLLVSDIEDNSRSRETIWVRFYSLETWNSTHGNCIKTIPEFLDANPEEESEFERDTLSLGPFVVNVAIMSLGDLGREFFRIQFETQLSSGQERYI